MTGAVPSDELVGRELAGYRVEALVGRGGMGAVYRARDSGLERTVALKVIAPELAGDRRFRDRFLRESRIAAAIEHPHVVPIFRAGEEDGFLFLAMRYVEGTDLARLLASEGALDPARALDLLEQVAEALDAAHERGLVHRDVKPSNVLIAEAAGKEHCYLADFGLTKRAGSLSGVSAAGDVVGTLDYVAPEQITGEDVNSRADLYSLGCVLYECLTGGPAFPRATDVALLWAHAHEQPRPPAEVRPELPAALNAVLARALAKDAAERYATAGELMMEARRALASSAARSAGPRRSITPALPRRRFLFAAAGAIALSLVLAVLLFRSNGGGLPGIKPNHVGIVDAESLEIVGEVPVGIRPGPIATTPDAVWVANRDDRTVTRIDARARLPVATIALENRTPTGIAVGANAVWVAHGLLGELSRIDPQFNRVTASINVSGGPARRPSPIGSVAVGAGAVWVAYGDSTLARIDPVAVRVTASTFAGAEPRGLVVALGDVWVLNAGEGDATVGRYRPATFEDGPIREVGVGRQAAAIAFGEGAIWVANAGEDTVTRIDTDTGTRTIEVGDRPTALDVGAGAVWVANTGAGTVSRIDPATNEVTDTIDVGSPPSGVAVGDGVVWIAAQER